MLTQTLLSKIPFCIEESTCLLIERQKTFSDLFYFQNIVMITIDFYHSNVQYFMLYFLYFAQCTCMSATPSLPVFITCLDNI